MERRNGWRRVVLVLILVLVLTALPAMAGERAVSRQRAAGVFGGVWEALVRWVAPVEWLAKLGPTMDPNGVTSGAGSGASNDLGPGMDPNGSTGATQAGDLSDLGPTMDPDG
jgi:hypothetical protein